MEHIDPRTLSAILAEGRRLLKPGGLAVHGIDYSDHFSHSDSNITAANFLRFSPSEWDRWAGNRYMYMNRLRHSEYLRLFEDNGLRVLGHEPEIDQRSLEALRTGAVQPHSQYDGRTPEELAARWSWITARPQREIATAAA